MHLKPICKVAHDQIIKGICPWCDTELSSNDSPQLAAASRTGNSQWNITAMDASLEQEDAEVRSTISNIMIEQGPIIEAAIPLLAKALEDDAEEVRRLTENALSSLGRDLLAEDVQRFEDQVQSSPHVLALRILLLAHYFIGQRASPAARDARYQHVLWIIQNAPDSHTAGNPDACILKRQNEEGYAETKSLWLEQVQRQPSNARIAGNAAKFFILNDKRKSEEFFQKAKVLEPENPDWPKHLGHLYSLLTRGKDAHAADEAKLALQELKASEKVRLKSNDSLVNAESDFAEEDLLGRINALPDLAKAALDAGEFEEARRYASELLTLTRSEDIPKYFREDGNAIHYSNLVLGRCELREGNIEQAKKHLIASGQTKGSPNLNSFGPNMSLAKDLLENGEQEVVIKFFELCRVFWESHADNLQEWSEQVQQGEIPHFGANLHY